MESDIQNTGGQEHTRGGGSEVKRYGNLDLRNMDCMELMAEYPDNHFDLCITSPPYNIGKTHHTGSNRFTPYKDDLPEREYQDSQISMLNELHRVMAKGGSLFYNHKNRIRNGLQITPYEWLLASEWDIKQEVVWINGSQNFDKVRFYPMTERIYWLSKGADTKFKNNIGLKDYNTWMPVGANGDHKRAFPIDMVKSILSCFPSGMRVIEPYLGSGTTAIACHYMGFDLTGSELDPDYYKAMMERIDRETSQMELF